MDKTVAVFGKTIKSAMDFLEILIGETRIKDAKQIIKSFDRYSVIMHDGTVYKVVVASESSRGHRFTHAYADKEIDKEYVWGCIAPYILPVDGTSERSDIIYY